MTNPNHISVYVDKVLEDYQQALLKKYKVKTIYDLHPKMLSETEQDLFYDLINKKRGNYDNWIYNNS